MANTANHDAWTFQGFAHPTTTPVPDELFDLLAPRLSEAELRVLLYIIRRTFGFKRDRDAISLTQMVAGIKTRDGKVLDQGTGMSRRGVMKGCSGLIEKGIIKVEKRWSEQGDNEINIYSLRFKGDQPVSLKETGEGTQKEHEGVGNNVPYGREQSILGVGNNVPPQQTVVQQTVKQDNVYERTASNKKKNSSEPQPAQAPQEKDASRGEKDQLLTRPPRGERKEQSVVSSLADILTQHTEPAVVSSSEPEDRDVIEAYIKDLAGEFRDRSTLRTSTTRALHLHQQANVPRSVFINKLVEMAARTRESVQLARHSEQPIKKPMALFFRFLEDSLAPQPRVRDEKLAPLPVEQSSEPALSISSETHPLWKAVKEEMARMLTSANYQMWLAPTFVAKEGEAVLQIGVPSPFHQQRIEKLLRFQVDQTMKILGHPHTHVEFIVASP